MGEAAAISHETNSSWGKNKTLLLVQLYGAKIHKFRDPKQKKKTLWEEIKIEMCEQGYMDITTEALDRKIRNMKKTYRTIKDNNKQTGCGSISWSYFSAFEEIFAGDKTVNPPFTISSLDPAPSSSNSPTLEIFDQLISEDLSPAPRSNTISSFDFSRNSTPQSSPVSTEQNYRKRSISKANYKQRADMMNLEAKRIATFEEFNKKLDEGLQVQRERNQILKAILENLSK